MAPALSRVWNSAPALLLVTGGFLGLILPLGKLAGVAGVPALLWALVVSVGAGGLLALVLLLMRAPVSLTAHKLRYYIIAALVSHALPNALLLSAIPHLGAGYTGIMYTLSPVLTLLLSLLAGQGRPSALGIAGIAVGFIGAAIVASTRGEAGQPAELHWILVALLVPVSLAVGNVYRTLDWPQGAGPLELAAGSHLAAAVMLLGALWVTGDLAALPMLADMPALVAAQVVAAAAMFAFFFRLQAVGGPVYLSQIGYVGAAVGLVSGVVFLGERYAALTWAGAAIVAAGIVLTTRAQRRAQRQP